ncbi:MAG: amino acid adenylation domain-containing protein [Actinophytocola sp.]|uniref:amino acid adenylation domain-containing protein n=1 Tax=Actinophytocola sp. TaxID=1872138 RepID=UPI003C71AD6F
MDQELRTSASYPRDSTIDRLFVAAAGRFGGRAAISWDGGVWTYDELAELSARVAGGLRAAGVTAGSVVGIVGGRCPEACVTMLAILRAGAAFLPLDDALPPARLREMVGQADPVLCVRLPNGGRIGRCVEFDSLLDGQVLPAAARPPGQGTDSAYIMFTSGSTGKPKGVVISHRGVIRLAVSNSAIDITAADRVMHGCTIAFDGSMLELWPALLNGGCVVLAERELLLDPAAFRTWLRGHDVTVAFLTTSVFHFIARLCPDAFGSLRLLFVGGEVLDPGLAGQVLRSAPPGRLVNAYGPTENTVFSTTHLVAGGTDDRAVVPIGRPIDRTTCYVLLPDGSLAPTGSEGELYVGGDGLAKGYLGDPAETAARFVTATPAGVPERLYRTGDIVARDEAGVLHYRGRRDNQVKVRGVRVELDEVSRLLAQHPDIDQAAVIAVRDEVSQTVVAFYTSRVPTPIPGTLLRRYLSEVLPGHSVPTAFHAMTRLPLTASGKVDHRELARSVRGDEPHPAGGPNEVLAHEWGTALQLSEPIDPEVDFFAAGGDSLRAARLIARVIAILGLDGASGQYLIRALLRTPRLNVLTQAVAAVQAGTATPDPLPADRWRADIRLHPAPVRTGPVTPPTWRDPRRVLLTGGTGFFGSYLLQELLTRTEAEICCVVRAEDDEHALARLHSARHRYGHVEPVDPKRIRALRGELSEHRFGWAEAAWAELAGSVDLVYHSGAQVNFVYPYEWLRRTNVEGTRNVVDFARARRDIPVHYISTIAVLAGFGSAGVTEVTEDTPLAHVERLSMGYPESKWVAEQTLRLAASQGLPVVIHRPYEITGNTTDGAWNTDAAICAFFKAITDMGSAPDLDLPLDFVPADYLASAVVHLATHVAPAGQTYHLTNPGFALLPAMVDRLRAHGHPIDIHPYHDWVHQLRDFAAHHETHPIVAFVPIFTDPAAARDITVKELYRARIFPAFTRHHTETDLKDAELTCPPVDDRLLDSYIAYFHQTGYLTPPRVATTHQADVP